LQTREFHTGGPKSLNENVAAMQGGDWITLFLTSTITAASVAAELRDIKLCQITAATAARTKATLPWRVALEVLQTFRQAFFLPLLVTLVPHVVVIRGGDSLNICFNTVAVLFLLQVDNQLYEYGLSEQVKAEVEEFGRVYLEPSSLRLLKASKLVHVVLVTASCTLTVATGHIEGGVVLLAGFMISQLVFFLGGIAEVMATAGLNTTRLIASEQKALDLCTNLCLGVGKMIFSLVMFINFFEF